MTTKPSAVPPGYNAVMPYLRVRDASAAMEFYKTAFGARERFRLTMSGKIGHAEVEIAGAVVMLSDAFPDMGLDAPAGSTEAPLPPMMLSVYVDDVDATLARAVQHGAKTVRPAKTEFYGERVAKLVDPFGHVWSLQQRIEDVSPAEMQRRLDAMMASDKKG
ncbi:MAG TPA: VOC family protein [Hyphomicrobiaceae bacterium]|nr:VOC family protein [Hyphomicrobiaceae bacterium]